MKDIVVTLGAGHGGHDIGTVGPGGIAEKDVALYIARCVRRRLEATGRFTVEMVRTGDFYIATPQRAQVAALVHSRCHVELHADLLAHSPKSAAVWVSADMPGDRHCAGMLSHRLAAVCGTPDCGARVRYDYCTLLGPMTGFEDYYAVIEALGGSGETHVFYCEFGLDGELCRRLPELRGVASRIAGAVARTVCELFAVRPQRQWQAPEEDGEVLESVHPQPVFLRRGLFYVRAGPGPLHPAARVISGLIYTDGGPSENGWMDISGPGAGKGGEYLSLAAVDFYLNALAAGPSSDNIGYVPETTRRESFSLVLAEPRVGAPVTGAVGPATCVLARREKAFRRITYDDRVGFLAPAAFAAE